MTATTVEHSGTYGACCAPPLPTTSAERAEHERGWRFHWGWVDAVHSGGLVPRHAAPDYVRGWEAALTAAAVAS